MPVCGYVEMEKRLAELKRKFPEMFDKETPVKDDKRMHTNDHAAERALTKMLRAYSKTYPNTPLFGQSADAIDRLADEAEALEEANQRLQAERRKAALRIEHSQECNYATAERKANAAL